MFNNRAVNKVVKDLGKGKEAFLGDIKTSIVEYVSAQGQGCLGLVERDASGGVHSAWKMEASKDYGLRLIAFVRGKDYKGRELDSVLTDPIVDIITTKFQGFYEANSQKIFGAFGISIPNGQDFSHILSDAVAGAAQKKPAFTRFAPPIVGKALQSAGIFHETKPSNSTMTVAVGGNIRDVIKNTFASEAIKKIVLFPIRRAIVNAIVLLLTQIGISSTLANVAFFVVGGYMLIRGFEKLPAELGEKVSSEVSKELDKRFDEINKRVIEGMVDGLQEAGLTEMAMEIVNDVRERFKQVPAFLKSL